MMNIIILIGVLFLLVIVYVLFRIGRLISVANKPNKQTYETNSNKVNAFMMLLFFIIGFSFFAWYSWTNFDNYNLAVASEHGELTNMLFWVTTGITCFVFIITNAILFLFSYKYQYKETNTGKFFPDNTLLELIWTVLPALVLTILVFTGLDAWNDITDKASDDAEVIEIMGYQFAWGVRYPGVKDNELGKYNYQLIDDSKGNPFGIDIMDENSYDDFTPLEMHLPKKKEVLLKIRARDVLHSVFLPHHRVKMDAVPGHPTHFKFVATKTTEEMREEMGNPDFDYFITCTEICGKGHFSMKLKVVVEEIDAYNKWKNEQQTWLELNPEFIKEIPIEKRELAKVKAGIEKIEISENF